LAPEQGGAAHTGTSRFRLVRYRHIKIQTRTIQAYRHIKIQTRTIQAYTPLHPKSRTIQAYRHIKIQTRTPKILKKYFFSPSLTDGQHTKQPSIYRIQYNPDLKHRRFSDLDNLEHIDRSTSCRRRTCTASVRKLT